MSSISKNWINEVYVSLTDTLANSEHKISSGITKKTFGNDKITEAAMDSLMSSISGLSSNYFIGTYADCFSPNDPLTNVTKGDEILEETKNEIDNYVTKILQICGNIISTTGSASGCTDKGNSFRGNSGCTDKGNTFTGSSGCTDKGNTFTAASGCTNYGNNFSAASGCNRCETTFTAASGCNRCGNTFRGASGCTDNGNSFSGASGHGNRGNGTDGNFRAASGNGNRGNNFRPRQTVNG
jgi:hypothetical protein